MRPANQHLRSEILDAARELAQQDHSGAINIRAIAKKCGIAPSTVYLYYDGKQAILLALAEEFWRSSLTRLESSPSQNSFIETLQATYQFLLDCMDDFRAGLLDQFHRPEFGQAKQHGKHRMDQMQQRLGSLLQEQLEQDPAIRMDAWDDDFTQAMFTQFVLGHLLFYLEHRAQDISPLLMVVQRCLY